MLLYLRYCYKCNQKVVVMVDGINQRFYTDFISNNVHFEKRRFSRDSSRLKRDSDSSRKLQRPQSRRLHGFIVQM